MPCSVVDLAVLIAPRDLLKNPKGVPVQFSSQAETRGISPFQLGNG